MTSTSRRFTILVCAALLIAASWCVIPLLQETAPPPDATKAASAEGAVAEKKAEKLERPGLPNLHRVAPDLYRGAQPDPKEIGLAELRKLGVKTVVNLRSLHGESDEVEAAGLQYKRIRFNPLSAPEDEEIVEFLKVVTDPKATPVFVHCQHGADRTGTMCAAYRVVVQGWSKADAVEEMKTGGFNFHAKYYEGYAKYIMNLDVDKIRQAVASKEPK